MDWTLDPSTVYLNHGSFGPPPNVVRKMQMELQSECNQQPMNFYLRRLEPLWYAARERLARFLNCRSEDLVFCENATAGMNHIASFFPLEPHDEVLLNNHEYGVVKQIWERACKRSQASYRECKIPLPIHDVESILQVYASSVTPRTKLIVISHITSPTAITFPIKEILEFAKGRGIAVCVDGPHAPIQVKLDIQSLDCDFYIASCHKWLSAPLGTGFTFVADKWHALASEPLGLSWGRLPPTPMAHWSDRHIWCGTRDYSGYLSIPTAIDAFEELDVDVVRERNHHLAQYARNQLSNKLGTEGLVPDHPDWYSMMVAVWLPQGDHSLLQKRLWTEHGIEVPIVSFDGKHLVRVSCHLYNTQEQIDSLVRAISKLVEISAD